MGKYLLRYLIFWLPAMLVATFFNNASMVSHLWLWFTAFFMVFGWGVNSGMAAYHYPRGTLSVLLTYTGFSILAIVTMYAAQTEGLRKVMRAVGGFLSFRPLDIFVQALRGFSIPQELCVLGFLVFSCAVGYIAGLVHRRVRPNPYSPRMRRAR